MVTAVVVFAPAALHRAAWQALLTGQPDLSLAGAIADEGGLAGCLRPDLPTTILIDVPEPRPDLAHRLKLAAPECGLLFLVHTFDLAAVVSLAQAGAAGCLSREASVGDLARALIAAGRGELVLPPGIAAQALAALTRGMAAQLGPAPALSARESEIVRLLAEGSTNKDIAQTLFLSVRTVEAHLRSIFGKLGVWSRTEAALWAVRNGYRGRAGGRE